MTSPPGSEVTGSTKFGGAFPHRYQADAELSVAGDPEAVVVNADPECAWAWGFVHAEGEPARGSPGMHVDVAQRFEGDQVGRGLDGRRQPGQLGRCVDADGHPMPTDGVAAQRADQPECVERGWSQLVGDPTDLVDRQVRLFE